MPKINGTDLNKGNENGAMFGSKSQIEELQETLLAMEESLTSIDNSIGTSKFKLRENVTARDLISSADNLNQSIPIGFMLLHKDLQSLGLGSSTTTGSNKTKFKEASSEEEMSIGKLLGGVLAAAGAGSMVSLAIEDIAIKLQFIGNTFTATVPDEFKTLLAEVSLSKYFTAAGYSVDFNVDGSIKELKREKPVDKTLLSNLAEIVDIAKDWASFRQALKNPITSKIIAIGASAESVAENGADIALSLKYSGAILTANLPDNFKSALAMASLSKYFSEVGYEVTFKTGEDGKIDIDTMKLSDNSTGTSSSNKAQAAVDIMKDTVDWGTDKLGELIGKFKIKKGTLFKIEASADTAEKGSNTLSGIAVDLKYMGTIATAHVPSNFSEALAMVSLSKYFENMGYTVTFKTEKRDDNTTHIDIDTLTLKESSTSGDSAGSSNQAQTIIDNVKDAVEFGVDTWSKVKGLIKAPAISIINAATDALGNLSDTVAKSAEDISLAIAFSKSVLTTVLPPSFSEALSMVSLSKYFEDKGYAITFKTEKGEDGIEHIGIDTLTLSTTDSSNKTQSVIDNIEDVVNFVADKGSVIAGNIIAPPVAIVNASIDALGNLSDTVAKGIEDISLAIAFSKIVSNAILPPSFSEALTMVSLSKHFRNNGYTITFKTVKGEDGIDHIGIDTLTLNNPVDSSGNLVVKGIDGLIDIPSTLTTLAGKALTFPAVAISDAFIDQKSKRVESNAVALKFSDTVTEAYVPDSFKTLLAMASLSKYLKESGYNVTFNSKGEIDSINVNNSSPERIGKIIEDLASTVSTSALKITFPPFAIADGITNLKEEKIEKMSIALKMSDTVTSAVIPEAFKTMVAQMVLIGYFSSEFDVKVYTQEETTVDKNGNTVVHHIGDIKSITPKDPGKWYSMENIKKFVGDLGELPGKFIAGLITGFKGIGKVAQGKTESKTDNSLGGQIDFVFPESIDLSEPMTDAITILYQNTFKELGNIDPATMSTYKTAYWGSIETLFNNINASFGNVSSKLPSKLINIDASGIDMSKLKTTDYKDVINIIQKDIEILKGAICGKSKDSGSDTVGNILDNVATVASRNPVVEVTVINKSTTNNTTETLETGYNRELSKYVVNSKNNNNVNISR